MRVARAKKCGPGNPGGNYSGAEGLWIGSRLQTLSLDPVHGASAESEISLCYRLEQ